LYISALFFGKRLIIEKWRITKKVKCAKYRRVKSSDSINVKLPKDK
jgi:hypothetical protein